MKHPIDCLCNEYNLSRYRLAKNMGVTYSTIQSIANRGTSVDNLDVGTLLKISNAVNLALDETYAKLKSYEQPKYKIRWTNGYGDEEGNIYPYQYFLEIDSKEKVKIPDTIMEEFIKDNSSYLNGVGTNMFRGKKEKEMTLKLVQILKNHGIIH